MVKKSKSNKKYIALFIAAFVLAVGITSVGMAGISLKQLIADKAGEILGNNLSDQMVEPEDITVGAFPGPDVYQEMHFHEGFRSPATLSVPLTWVSSTYGFATANDPTVNVKQKNTGSDMWCSPPMLDLFSAVTSFGGSYVMGTSSPTGDSSLTNTSTATLMELVAITTTTDTQINGKPWGPYFGSPGTHYRHNIGSSTPWLWQSQDYLVVSMSGAGGATSTESVSAAGKFLGKGELSTFCWERATSTDD